MWLWLIYWRVEILFTFCLDFPSLGLVMQLRVARDLCLAPTEQGPELDQQLRKFKKAGTGLVRPLKPFQVYR